MKEILHKHDGTLYNLLSYVVMPNHVHILFKQISPLKVIMKQLKGSSSFALNKLLNKKGTFWQHDYYDRVVRDEKHFLSTLEYIKDNAVKAGLEDCRDRYFLSDIEV